MLSENVHNRITTTLQQLETSNGAQVAVLTITGLQGESLEDYSIRVAETWKLGRKDIDDGVLLLVARDDRKIRIEVGYGLEGVLTDLDSRRIIDNLMVPAFRNGDYEGGIEAAVNAISGAIQGDAGAIPVMKKADLPNGGGATLAFFALFMIPFAQFAVALKGRQGWTLYLFLAPFFYFVPLMLGQTAALITLAAWLITVPILRAIWPEKWRISPGTGRGSGGGFGGGGGVSGGGGFSGGGGGFGGGGASGGW